MKRPDDVLPWRQCFWLSWKENWFLLPVFSLITPSFVYIIPQLVLTETGQKTVTSRDEFVMSFAMLVIVAFMWMAIFLLRAASIREAKTPKEIEARERAFLAQLKDKYEK